ncbi:MAG TPA: periplasmic heavy metal sensor [Alphaproteobacteria bacterium]
MPVVLVASLGLNVFLAGIVGGSWFSDEPSAVPAAAGAPNRGPGGDMPGRSLIRRMAATLPPEHRTAFEATMASHRPELEKAAAAVREARDMVRNALAQDPFDRAALDAAFTELRRRNDVLQATIQRAIAEAAADLPVDARKRLLAWRSVPPPSERQ